LEPSLHVYVSVDFCSVYRGIQTLSILSAPSLFNCKATRQVKRQIDTSWRRSGNVPG